MARSVAWNNALRRLDTRNTSQLVKSNSKRAFLVHTLPLSEMMQESALSKFKKRMQSSQATNAGIRIEASTESRGGCNIIPLSSLILSKQQLFQGFTLRPAAWYKASMTPYLHFGGHHFSVFFRAISTAPTAEDSQVEGGLSRVNDPTHEVAPRIKFKRLSKTAKHIMQILDVEAVQEVKAQREIPNIKPGHIVQLKVEVPENKRRVSVIKGIVIARRNAGLNTTVRIRRLVAGVGVESVFPLYSPNIKEIKVLDQKEVRRAKLYYLRDRMASADRK